MKERFKFKKILSYFLIFAMAFSFMQLGQAKSASAASVSSMIEGFDFYVGNSTTGRPLGVDKDTSGNYVIRGVDMAKNYTLIPKTGYDLVKVECDSDYASAVKSAYGSNSMWTITNIKNYEAFSIKVTVKDSEGNISNPIPILLEIKEVESLMFSRLEVTIDNDTPLSYDYNAKGDDGVYRVGPLPSTAKKATIQMYDAFNNSMNFTINGSTTKTFNLVGGDNEFELKVTNSGYSRIYKLVIEKNGEAKLKSLVPSVGSLSPSFKSDTTDYTITVPTNVDKIAFTPTAIDNSCTIKIKKVAVASGKKSQDISLDEGDNKISITVTSKTGGSTVYTVVVTRTEKFRSADLKSLKLTSGSLSPAFNKGVYEYTAIVENSVSSVGVIPVAEDAEATIRVEGKKLPSGATSPYISLDEGGNVINVKVTDTKGNENTYVIMITRKYSKNNVNLSSLTVTDGTFSPKFDPEIYAYSVKVPRSVEEVRIKFESQNEKAKISVNGAEYQSGQQTDKIKLNLGANTVTVKVVAEDGKTTTNYVLSIIRDKVQGTISDWVLVGGEWMFYNGDGIPAKNQWIKYDNQWYHVDINGYMNKNGWLFDGGEWYYLDPNGIMLHGWIKDTGYWYYFRENGPMVSNTWAQLDGNWYFFNQYGQMQTGWLLYLGKWYYMDDHGVMQKGWITYDKNKYYLDDDGTMRNGWLYNGKTWYYFDESGRMITGWQTIGNRTYYFDSKGAMKTGMLFLDGRWINLDSL